MDFKTRPATGDYNDYFKRYIDRIPPESDLLQLLESDFRETEKFILSLSEEQLNHRYAPDKWSIKEIINHLTDGERVFAYRAMRISRKDQTVLPGFDENLYVPNAKASARSISSLISEFSAVRRATIELFKNFDSEMLAQTGTASNYKISVRALGFIIAGHELHHMNVIKERYLKG
ncbi:DinB family protein [bacterium]|nr:DinB family protein [bacterium]